MEGKDFDVWYNGIIIGNVKASSQANAEKLVEDLYSKPVTVTESHVEEPDISDDDGLTDGEADAITLGERQGSWYDDYYDSPDFAYDHVERDHDEPYEPDQG